jgi:hypothetical protein
MRFITVLVAVVLPISAVVKPSIAQTASDATSKPARSAERKYPIFDSRTRAHTFGATDPQFFWIDNNEVLFLAVEAFTDGGAPNNERVKYTVARWDIRSGAISKVRDFGEDRPRICYYEGQVLYQFRRRDDSLVAYHGNLGEPERAVDPREYGQLFCRALVDVPDVPNWMKGREFRHLERIGDGFVDFGEQKTAMQNTPVRLYRFDERQEEGIELPFGRRDIGRRFPYYAFRGAYFVESHYYVHPRPQSVPYPVFWLHRDGRIEKILDIPWGPWRSSASFFPFPTRIGVVMASSNFNVRNSNDLAHAGLYLSTREGRVEKLLKAWIEGLGVRVSPDGCKIAFTYAPVVTRKNNLLQAMDLCLRN